MSVGKIAGVGKDVAGVVRGVKGGAGGLSVGGDPAEVTSATLKKPAKVSDQVEGVSVGSGQAADTGIKPVADKTADKAAGDKNVSDKTTPETKTTQGSSGNSRAGVDENVSSERGVSEAAGSDRVMGEGGTSQVDVLNGSGETLSPPVNQSRGHTHKAVKTAVAFSAATQGAGLLILTMILNWLKGIIAAIIAAIKNLLALLVQFVTALVSKAVSFFSGVLAAVGNVFGFSVAASTTIGSILFSTVFGGFLAVWGWYSMSQNEEVEPVVTNCVAEISQSASYRRSRDVSDLSGVGRLQLQNAKTIYSVLRSWGMSKYNIAGILGNWQAESGLDATSVESSQNAPYSATPIKLADAQNPNRGIGIGQWTFSRNSNLRVFAENLGANWWELNIQLAFMMSEAEGENAKVLENMIGVSQLSPGAAAIYFHDNWEHSADTPQILERRKLYAQEWFMQMDGWEPNHVLASSILIQSGNSLSQAHRAVFERAISVCRGLGVDNAVLVDGGMTVEQAQKLIDLYNVEGDEFLDNRYGPNGGPFACGDNHAMNCVSFSTYFLNKYTSFQHYPSGNGKQTAFSVARDTGKITQTVPVAYSVASRVDAEGDGHTLIVLGVDGDNVIVGEAGYCTFMGRVRVVPVSSFSDTVSTWVFVDLNDMLLPSGQEMGS